MESLSQGWAGEAVLRESGEINGFSEQRSGSLAPAQQQKPENDAALIDNGILPQLALSDQAKSFSENSGNSVFSPYDFHQGASDAGVPVASWNEQPPSENSEFSPYDFHQGASDDGAPPASWKAQPPSANSESSPTDNHQGASDSAAPAESEEAPETVPPAETDTMYRIAPGDTLWEIAAQVLQKESSSSPSDTDIANRVQKIAAENNISCPDLIYAGDVIRLSR